MNPASRKTNRMGTAFDFEHFEPQISIIADRET
jgi:hypothetical protein